MTTPELARLPANASVSGPGTGSASRQRIGVGRTLRIEPLEGELGEGNDRRARARRPLDRREPAADVVLLCRRSPVAESSAIFIPGSMASRSQVLRSQVDSS